MKRRELVLGAASGLVLANVPILVQAKNTVPVVALLITHPPVDAPIVQIWRSGMLKHGYIDGQNVRLVVRTALGQLDQVPAIARELVDMPADVIVIVNEIALKAVKEATSTTPIVMVGFTDDPVEEGWIDSYRRPGTNVTGIFNVNANLVAKRLEVLKEVIPGLSRVAVFWDPVFGRRQLDTLQHAGKVLDVELDDYQVARGEDLPAAISRAKRRKAGAIMLLWSPVFYVHRQELAELALEAGLPTMADQDYLASSGCMVFYGAVAEPAFERAAYFVDRLLKGATPGELPVEQMSDVKLIVNLKTAAKLGTQIPQSILLRADEVIE